MCMKAADTGLFCFSNFEYTLLFQALAKTLIEKKKLKFEF